MGKSAVVFGATGLIGRHLLQFLLEDPAYHRVIAVVRRKTGFQHTHLQEVIADFDTLETVKNELVAAVFFCCLGSTRKKTPNLDDYYQIDHNYPVAAAEIAKANGAKTFVLVSAVGANPDSRNFYIKMKGETERDVIKAGVSQTCVFRPSLLTGHRHEKRILERLSAGIMAVVNPLLIGKLNRYRSVPARRVAKAMKEISQQTTPGVAIYYWKDINMWQ